MRGSCYCGLSPPPWCLNDGVCYAGTVVNGAAHTRRGRSSWIAPICHCLSQISAPKALGPPSPCPSAHKRSRILNISCCSLGYFGGERSPWSDLVFSNKCALCCCSLLRNNTAQAESSAWPLIEHKCCFVRPRVITWTSANGETKH